MSNPSSLKPFQPGDDPRRNTKGRPKGSKNMKNLLLKEIRKSITLEDGTKMKMDELIVRRIVDIALFDPKGDRRLSAIKFIWEQIDGKAKATAELPTYRDWTPDPVAKRELFQKVGLEIDEKTNQEAEKELKRREEATRSAPPPIELNI